MLAEIGRCVVEQKAVLHSVGDDAADRHEDVVGHGVGGRGRAGVEGAEELAAVGDHQVVGDHDAVGHPRAAQHRLAVERAVDDGGAGDHRASHIRLEVDGDLAADQAVAHQELTVVPHADAAAGHPVAVAAAHDAAIDGHLPAHVDRRAAPGGDQRRVGGDEAGGLGHAIDGVAGERRRVRLHQRRVDHLAAGRAQERRIDLRAGHVGAGEALIVDVGERDRALGGGQGRARTGPAADALSWARDDSVDGQVVTQTIDQRPRAVVELDAAGLVGDPGRVVSQQHHRIGDRIAGGEGGIVAAIEAGAVDADLNSFGVAAGGDEDAVALRTQRRRRQGQRAERRRPGAQASHHARAHADDAIVADAERSVDLDGGGGDAVAVA